MRTRGLILTLMGAMSLAACAGSSSEFSNESSAKDAKEIRPIERKIVGRAAPYEADFTLRARTAELASSQKARREAAWQAVARALEPIALAEKSIPQDGGSDAAVPTTLPAFRTWYNKDDFGRTFAQALSSMSPEDRAKRRPPTEDQIEAALEWNATSKGSASDEDYARRLALLVDGPAVDGVGGNQRVAYSPGAVTHMMRNYAPTLGCVNPRSDDPEPTPTSFSPCFGEEMPPDAALVKMAWNRADFGRKLPTHDTSAATLAKRLRGEVDEGGWGTGAGEASPGAADIYTVRMSDGTTFRLAGLHLMTKELREWMWITIWWSNEPETDFGADRPDAIRELGGPWSHYKMCAVTAYDELDPDPRGGYDGSLGDALAAVHGGTGAPSWCSNPYIERGAHNAQTNCVGCHQHSATALTSESILSDATRFPASGRTRLRRSFLSDYLWALGSPPEQLAHLIESHVLQ